MITAVPALARTVTPIVADAMKSDTGKRVIASASAEGADWFRGLLDKAPAAPRKQFGTWLANTFGTAKGREAVAKLTSPEQGKLAIKKLRAMDFNPLLMSLGPDGAVRHELPHVATSGDWASFTFHLNKWHDDHVAKAAKVGASTFPTDQRDSAIELAARVHHVRDQLRVLQRCFNTTDHDVIWDAIVAIRSLNDVDMMMVQMLKGA